jgi:DNA-binding response OmpR family regulator
LILGVAVPSKPKVLVIEGDLDSYQALSKILKHVGYETLSAASLTAARQLIDADPPPRFLVLDLTLPDGSGKELLRDVRERKLPAKVAVLAEPSADKALLDEVRQLAPDALFNKPLNVPRLLAWLRQGGSGPSDL